MTFRSCCVVGLVAAALSAADLATVRAASPQLNVVLPRGAQRGTEAKLTLTGARLKDAQEVLFYDSGFEVTKLEPAENGQTAVATVKIAPNCRLGEHILQVRTASGVSEYRTFWVGPFPETAEVEPNNAFESPQAVPYGTTVTGLIESEDVDHYVVEAKKGERISVEIEALRLGTNLNNQFDPTVTILDAERFELLIADDTPLVNQDAVASIVAPKDGRYVIQVRDASYGGNGNCQYRLHVGQFPRPLAVYPAGGPAGQEMEVTFFGDPTGPFTQKITTPSDPNVPFAVIAEQNGLAAPSENPFRISTFGNLLEAEPNNTAAEATGPAQPAPIALNGVLAEPGDIDFLRFKATKGQVFRIECFGRRIRTPIDAVMTVHKADGAAIASNDDNGGPDPIIDFTVPEDGEYLVSVRDHLGRGGAEYVYRVEIAPPKPSLALSIPRVQRYLQMRQQIVIPRGGYYPTVLNGSRQNFAGEIVLEADALPEGVTMTFEPMAANLSSMPVVFAAAADAPLTGKLIDLKGFQKDGSRDHFGQFTNTADLLRYLNDAMLWTATVDRLPVAVVEKLPFSVEIVQPTLPLVRKGRIDLKVIAKRDEGFTAPITVEFPFRPPGVSTLPTMRIEEGKTEVIYPINANENAQVGDWKVFSVAYADVNGQAVTGTPLTNLKVADNNVDIAIERGAVIQGQKTELIGTVTIKTPFEGKGTATLLGLPNKVTAEPIEITNDTKEIRFAVNTTAESPVGRHQSVLCEVNITHNGEAMIHTAGVAELRIDAPPPAPKDPPKETAAAPPAPPSEKPLSRLEQLRLEAKQKGNAQ